MLNTFTKKNLHGSLSINLVIILILLHKQEKKTRPQSTDDKTILAEQTENRLCLGTMNNLLLYQQIYQVKHLAQPLFTKIMLEFTHLRLTQRL